MTDIRICFIGDSFVNGTGDETALGWAGRLCCAANRHTSLTYYNLGVRRDTSADILNRWQTECLPRLPTGCDGRIVLSCGVNDTVFEQGRARIRSADSCQNIKTILKGAEAYQRLLIGPPAIADTEQNLRIGDLSRRYAELAEELEVPYIDLFAPLIDDHVYQFEVAGNDGAHPRNSGYAKMAQIIAASPHWWFR